MKNRFIIAGVDRTKDILFTQSNRPTIERRLRQEADCRFVVKSNPRPSEGEEIIIYNQDNAKLFAGIIDEVHDMELGQGIHILYSCKARDYTYQLNRKLVVETYENQSADVIVRDILTKYAPNFSDTFVESDAPVVEWITFDYKMPSECFQELCDYVGWYWYVDYDKAVHFFNPQELPKPAPMIIQPGGGFRNFRRSIDIVGLRNRVYVRGGSMLSDPQVVQWKADGVARIWTLPWGPHEVSFKVGEVPMTVGVENLHEESEYDYMMSFSEKYIRCSSHTSTPVEGITMELTAKQDIPVITMVEDYHSQAAVKAVQSGDGIYEHVIVDDTLTSIVAAEAAGMADLREHANPRVKGSFETEFSTPPEIVERLIDEAAVFTRASKAYLSDGTEVDAGVPRFEQGKFGQAVRVEEGTTNLLTNPSFEGTYTSGIAPNWTSYASGSATGSYTESTDALAGSKAQRITRTGGATSDRWGIKQTSSILGGTNATISVYIKVLSFTSGAIVRLYGDFTGGPYGVGQAYTITSDDVGKWIKLQGSATVDSTATCIFYVWIDGANADILVDCAQVEAKPYTTSFIDSTRSPETLTIPTAGVLNPQEGAIAFRWIPQTPQQSGGNCIFSTDSTNRWDLWWRASSTLQFYSYGLWANTGIAPEVGTPYFITITWKDSQTNIYVNGAEKASIAGVDIGDTAYIGTFKTGGYHSNSLFDELTIFDYAPTDEEIQAWYEADAPIPVNEHTTLKMPFNNSLDAFGSKIVYTHWQPGQLVTINLPDRGIEGEYLIQRVTASPLTSKLWTFRVEFGGRLLGIEDFLQALVSAQRKKRYIEPTKNVQKYIYVDETLQVSDELSTAIRVLPFICGDSDAICGMVVVSNG